MFNQLRHCRVDHQSYAGQSATSSVRAKKGLSGRLDALLETFGVPSAFCSDAGIWRPLTALTTDTAGVMMPSPIRAPAAQQPSSHAMTALNAEGASTFRVGPSRPGAGTDVGRRLMQSSICNGILIHEPVDQDQTAYMCRR